ncbi:MAG: radical SAM family heme chaperone HemW [Ruminococcus sp.]|uniref:radical SAM family heme chaperone HemW n=1 Tax=Ruminococcus sp. TaxID=41978 RepID=UPI0028736A92|nr:radical SAM family heme chaperone HemW [Ruminococcus sp.]MBQ3284106.1 radical SAM family heme chaperone HemW [Ruminococcus sp.]
MNTIGLYLHIPFCDGKCAYCNFFSRRGSEEQLNTYADHLITSIRGWGERLDRTVDTVYFGGGTPSLLGHERLIRILNSVFESFNVDENAEITVEVNPTSTDELDFRAMRTAGFNRLSIGLQSANDNELKILGRRHTAADAKRTVERAQTAGFDNISLDVMLAVPEQTNESLDSTLAFCASCGVQHISAYILKIEEGTRFYALKDQLPLFDDDEQAAFYEQTVGTLSDLGYRQYEISNFAKEGYESRHNLHYWHDDEYIGLGPSAHSFIEDRRFYYDSDFQRFYHNEVTEESTGGDSDEYIMLALRLTEGLVFEHYEQRFGQPVNNKLISAAKRLEQQGLCHVDEKGISLTVKGFLVSNAVISYLIS